MQYTITMVAINSYGTSAASSTLTWGTITGPPTSLTGSSNTTTTITYTFTAPTGTVSSYTATAVPTSGTTIVQSSITSSPVTITGLQMGMQYTITMVAINSYGTSAASTQLVYSTVSINYNKSSNIAMAYSVRILVNGYTGPVFKVLRSSDNALQDFYTDSTQSYLTTGANNTGTTYSSWIGANAGYIDKWYNQGGDATRDAVYSSTYTNGITTRPRIYLQNSKYVIYFNTQNDVLVFGNYINTSTIFGHFTCTNGSNGGTLISTNGDGGLRLFSNSVYGGNNSADWLYVVTSNKTAAALTYNNNISTTTISGSQWNVLSLSVTTTSPPAFGLYVIGNPTQYARGLGGYVSEVFCHNTKMTTQDIQDYYNNRLF
jgi:hypothetical protein